MTRISALATFGAALALCSAQPVYAATSVSEAASAWTGQFSGERSVNIHMPAQGRTLGNPAEDYIRSLQSTFRAEKRAGAQATDNDAFHAYINQFD